MGTEVRLRRGTAAQHETFTGALAEVTVVTDDLSLRVHDGATPGGHPIEGGGASLDMAEGTVKGRAIGEGAGPPQDLTADQVRKIAGVKRASAVYSSNALLSTVIPLSGSVNTNTHGTEIATVSLAASSNTAKIRIEFDGIGTHETSNNGLCALLFVDAETTARRLSFVNPSATGFAMPMRLVYEFVPGDTAPHTYRIRVGSSGGSMRLNSSSGGGTVAAILTAEDAGEPP